MKKISALQNLRETSKNQQEAIQEAYKKNLEELNKNLENIYKEKLVSTKSNTVQNSANDQTLEEIDTKVDYIKSNFFPFASIALIVGITIGILIGLLISSNALAVYIKNKDWIVPKEHRLKTKDGYFITNKKDTWNLDNKTSDPSSKIIKIGDL